MPAPDGIAAVLEGRELWAVEEGNSLDVLRSLPSESVHAVVTSPPYWGKRAYRTEPQVWGGEHDCEHLMEQVAAAVDSKNDPDRNSHADTNVRRLDLAEWRHLSRSEPSTSAMCVRCGAWFGELGNEPTPELFVEHMVVLFREVRRVLRKDGVLWLNIDDSYAGSGRGPTGHNGIGDQEKRQGFAGGDIRSGFQSVRRQTPTKRPYIAPPGLKPKDLCLIPARISIAFQADGWWVRDEAVWVKAWQEEDFSLTGSAMPGSQRDRFTSAWERFFQFTKGRRCYFDIDATRTRPTAEAPNGATLRNVFRVNPEGYAGAHFATFPSKLITPLIAASTSEKGCCAKCGAPWRRVTSEPSGAGYGKGWTDHAADSLEGRSQPKPKEVYGSYEPRRTIGWEPTCRCKEERTVPAVVLDPFVGSGTTVLAALRLGRRAIGIELSTTYALMARQRVLRDAPLFNAQLEVLA